MVPTVKLSSGYDFPILGLGTWKSQPGQVAAAVKHALKVGYRHIDCAYVYENEAEVGQGLKEAMEELGIKREEIFVTSKLWNVFHHPDDVEMAFKRSLDALGLEYLDLFLIHWPTAFLRGMNMFPRNEDGDLIYDSSIPHTDTWKAFEKLVEKGLVKSIGVSNFSAKQLKNILEVATIKPVTNQIECHPYLAQKKMLEFCKENDIVVTGYSPLGSPDRPWATPEEPVILEDPRIVDIAKKYEKSPAQVLIRWQTQRGIVVIPKSVTPARIEENFNIFDFSLSEEDIAVLESFDCNGRIVIPMKNGRPRDETHPNYPFHDEF